MSILKPYDIQTKPPYLKSTRMAGIEEEGYPEQEYELEEEETEEDSNSMDEDDVPPPVVKNLHHYEYTLALVKPHAFCLVHTIEQTIQEKGFSIIRRKTLYLTPERATEFFLKREPQDLVKVPKLICYMASGLVHVMVLAREKAIRRWQHLMGPADPAKAREIYPRSLRAKYGKDEIRNALYGSRNYEEAAEDIRFFFKDMIIDPPTPVKPSGDGSCAQNNDGFLDHKLYLQEHVYPTLQKGLIELVRVKPAQSFPWFVNWLLENDPLSPKVKPCELTQIPN